MQTSVTDVAKRMRSSQPLNVAWAANSHTSLTYYGNCGLINQKWVHNNERWGKAISKFSFVDSSNRWP